MAKYKKLILAIAVVTALFAGDVALAGTVGWWRFCDLGREGGKAGETTTFTNSVDGSKFPAMAKSFSGMTPGTEEEFMPSTTNSFGKYESLTIVDPESGEEHETTMALHCPWGGNGSKKSGGAVVESNPLLIGQGEGQTGDFTFECFFRTTAAGLARSASMEGVAGQQSSSYEGAWDYMINNKKIWARVTVKNEGGERQASQATGTGPTVVTPDVWHHAAITFKSETGTFRLYLDYKEEVSYSFGSKSFIAPGDGKNIWFGKGPEGVSNSEDRSLDGDICEARISDKCLLPDKFLRFKEMWHGDREVTDEDTVFHLSMDSADTFDAFMITNANLKTGAQDGVFYAELVNPAPGDYAVFDNEVMYNSRIRPSVSKGDWMQDSGSLHEITNGVDRTDLGYVKVLDDMTRISSASFTQEMFFKVDHPCVVGAGYTSYSYGLMCSRAFKVLINQATGYEFCRFKLESGDVDVNGTQSVNNGAWHHVAVVYDATKKVAEFYMDYNLIGSVEGKLKCDTASGNTPWVIGAAIEGGSHQVFDGWIDEVRLTRRALSPREFLTKSEQMSEDVVAWIHFDGDFSISPFPTQYLVTNATDTAGEAVTLTNRSCSAKITDDSNKVLYANNTGSVSVAGRRLYSQPMRALRLQTFTADFFFRPNERFAAWGGPLAYTSQANDNQVGMSYYYNEISSGWMIGGPGHWNYAQYYASVAITNSVEGGAKEVKYHVLSPAYQPTGPQNGNWRPAAFDGKWHHVALTVSYDEAANKTRVKAYWDHKCNWDETFDGEISYSAKLNDRLSFGVATANRALQADIDEVRIVNRVLEPKEFMRVPRLGSVILVR